MTDPIRAAVLSRLGRAPNGATLRAVAAELRGLAEELERRAEADARVRHQVRRGLLEQEASETRIGRPRGGARFVRLEAPQGQRPTWRVLVGRALWRELGAPGRLDLQRVDGAVQLRPVVDGGFAVSQSGDSMPRFSCGQPTIETMRLQEGRYEARIDGGAIVLGGLIEQEGE